MSILTVSSDIDITYDTVNDRKWYALWVFVWPKNLLPITCEKENALASRCYDWI